MLTSQRIHELINILVPGTVETLYMIFFSSLFSITIGTVLGIILYITKPNGLTPNKIAYQLIGGIVNIARSIPFIILIIIIFPFTRFLIGTSIGTKAATVSLVIAAIPFVARIMESSFNELDLGVIEASIAMGATNFQIIFKVLIPETIQSIVSNITITIINIVGYTAMAGTLGGGGLGQVAIRYGYNKFQNDTLFLSVLLLIIIVQIVQTLGNYAANNIVAVIHKFKK